MQRHIATVLCLLAAIPLAAQTKDQRQRDDARVGERAQTMREQIDSGGTVRSHVRVLVRLKNGNKLRGVVKDGRFVERVDGLRFVDAHANDRGAGIRLWYTGGARSYVFVPFADFAEYTVLQRLSAEELDQLEQQMQMEEARKAERLAAAARSATGAARPGPQPGDTVEQLPPAPGQEPDVAPGGNAGKGSPKAGTPAGAGGDQEQQRLWFQLLQDYPPQSGWNRSKRDEIARRKVVVGANPSEHEKRFVEQFAEWEKACKHFGIDAEAPKVEESTGTESEKDRGSRRRRR